MKLVKSLMSFSAMITLGVLLTSPSLAGTLDKFTSDVNGFDTHTYWYDDGKEVTLIDTQFIPALTQAMVDQIKRTTSSPITRVIVTHPNPDKFNGLPLLHTLGIESIASKASADAMPGVHAYKKYFWTQIAKAFTEESYPKFEPVRSTFSGQTVIKLKSGETLTLFELKNSGVSSTQTVVRIDRSGDLIVGDLVHYKAHAWLEGGIVNGTANPDLKAWALALAELPKLTPQPKVAKVYGGRGAVGTVNEVVSFQVKYLEKADALVNSYIKKTPAKDLQDATQSQKHYTALQTRFDKEMPGLALPYLVGYGIYGLLNSKTK